MVASLTLKRHIVAAGWDLILFQKAPQFDPLEFLPSVQFLFSEYEASVSVAQNLAFPEESPVACSHSTGSQQLNTPEAKMTLRQLGSLFYHLPVGHPCRKISFFFFGLEKILHNTSNGYPVINVGKHKTRISCRSSSSLLSSIFNEKHHPPIGVKIFFAPQCCYSRTCTRTHLFSGRFSPYGKLWAASVVTVLLLHGKREKLIFFIYFHFGVLDREQRFICYQSNRGGQLLCYHRNQTTIVLILYSSLLGAHSRRGILLVLWFRTSVWNLPLFFTKIHTSNCTLKKTNSGDSDRTITQNYSSF